MPRKPRLRLVPKDEPVDQEEADYLAVAVEEDAVASTEPAARPATGSPWDKFSREWAMRLKRAHADGSMWALGHTLLVMASNRDCIAVTTAVMTRAGLARHHKREILGRLERLGLITVEGRGQKTPVVTPHYPPAFAKRPPR
jgi:hypothetical protein